ncbi:D-2-hydroxyglutarate dehydrogenase YdiJ [Delftia acidovorans]|uniref:D-2-hydroxyglutarate dehydrogenase YdiJ n=1 Tax=Delftia acidovorans TaxID=80866 RepID=UPI0030193F10
MSIAPLPHASAPVPAEYLEFLEALKAAGFEGDVDTDHASRTVLATDNSIYQRMPQAAIYPRHAEDVARAAQVLARPEFRDVVLTPRGGGTGTNGQSLTHGVTMDLSRHMNGILEINAEQRWVRVQAGVVKDQLNAALRPHGLFFAPELSTSNRATIGGMINTDASGQGSCTYGKTRDHVLALDFVLLGGERLHSAPLDAEALERMCADSGRIGKVYRTARRISEDQAGLIEARFPKLNRCLTGYDLAHLREGDGRFNLNSVLCGAEGSLGFVVEARLNVLPIPRYSVLVNVRYAGFMDALRDARALMAHRPLSIETVDSKVLLLAMKDFVWSSVAEYFPQDGQRPTLGINLVEFSGDDPHEVDGRVQAFLAHLGADASVQRLGHTLAAGNAAVHRVYAMRKRAVGLLGNVAGEARPQPFVEDTAVPPENLPEFIAEFRALLDSHGLQYGMFGHVDAGVLHVRPILDMKNPVDAALVRPISDAVAELTQRHGGLLWGEHGKGLRSEYVPAFFGELYPSLQQLKAAFDPHNQLNPGKIATPPASKTLLLKVDGVTTRGELDRQIDERVWQSYGAAMHCNGNGACYNFDPDDAMCPSWKATRQRVHSPKGRASLMREWLRLQGQAGVNVLEVAQRPQPFLSSLAARWRNSRAARRGEADFSHEVYDAMAGCLACKSCAGQCPVKVNVPEFRSRFLELYHRRYLRPVRDYLIGSLEFTMPWLARMPALYNGVMGSPWMRDVLSRRIGMVDGPLLSRQDLAVTLRQWKVRAADAQALAALTHEQRARSVVIVQDSFTRYFETGQLQVLIELAARLGFQVWLAPLLPNGKPLHVQGFMGAFARAAIRNAAQLAQLAQSGVALVGLDPAMTLAYRQEYLKVPGLGEVPKVALPQEWLLQVLPEAVTSVASVAYRLLPHCTEKTNAPDSGKQWTQLFERRGLRLSVEATGCCGMSGTYGHEARNLENSKVIYAQSWEKQIESKQNLGEPLATGYSCRSQVKRLSARQLRHPLEALLDHVRATHQG